MQTGSGKRCFVWRYLNKAVIICGCVGRADRDAFLLFCLHHLQHQLFIYPQRTSVDISVGTKDYVFMTLDGFSPCTQVISLPAQAGCFTVALWRGGVGVSAFVTIKQCRTVLGKNICLFVMYTGVLVALPAWTNKNRCSNNSEHLIMNLFSQFR